MPVKKTTTRRPAGKARTKGEPKTTEIDTRAQMPPVDRLQDTLSIDLRSVLPATLPVMSETIDAFNETYGREGQYA